MVQSRLVAELVAITGRTDLEEWWHDAIHISHDRSWVYFEIPKAACTSLKNELRAIEGLQPLDDPKAVHDRTTSGLLGPADIPDLQLADISAIGHVFAVVRNPLHRLESGFRSKIVRSLRLVNGRYSFNGHPAFQRIFEAMAAQGFSTTDGLPSLDAFCRYVAQQPDGDRNVHWRSQTSLLPLEALKLKTLQLEGQDPVEALRRALEISTDRPSPHLNETTTESSIAALDIAPATQALVRECFRQDYERFGYDTDLTL